MSDQPVRIISDESLPELARELLAAADARPGRRYLQGVAGIPGSGKSTFASQLLSYLQELRPGAARLIPMDGFHLPDSKLEEMGLRSRKGSPATFDAKSYIAMLQQAQLVDSAFSFPIYDRKVHAAVYRDDPAAKIDPAVRIVLTEGNYLLLKDQPWMTLRHVLDSCWFLHTDPDKAQRWMIGRHVQGGRTQEEARKRYDHNDGPNTYHILTHSREPDLVLSWPE